MGWTGEEIRALNEKRKAKLEAQAKEQQARQEPPPSALETGGVVLTEDDRHRIYEEEKAKRLSEVNTASDAVSTRDGRREKQSTKLFGYTFTRKQLFLTCGALLVLSHMLIPSHPTSSPSQTDQVKLSKAEQEILKLSKAEQEILTDIEETRKSDLPPKVIAEQESFAKKSIAALHCIEGTEPDCTISELELHLTSLPVGWVEHSLGSPDNMQKINGKSLYYWNLNVGGSRCRLQLQYDSSCTAKSVNGGTAACHFNFYC
jgi:hypothetical protein